MITNYRLVELESDSLGDQPLEDGVMYVLNGRSALFCCPCGCGTNVFLRVGEEKPHHRPSWEFRRGNHGPSLNPSIKDNICGAHYWIRDGVVSWAEPPPKRA